MYPWRLHLCYKELYASINSSAAMCVDYDCIKLQHGTCVPWLQSCCTVNILMRLICSLALTVLCDPAYYCLSFAIMQLTILFAISLQACDLLNDMRRGPARSWNNCSLHWLLITCARLCAGRTNHVCDIEQHHLAFWSATYSYSVTALATESMLPCKWLCLMFWRMHANLQLKMKKLLYTQGPCRMQAF